MRKFGRKLLPAALGLSALSTVALLHDAGAGFLPQIGVFPVHQGILAPLQSIAGLGAIHRIEVQKEGSLIEFSRCSGAFISDRHFLTAAHCFGAGRKTYLFNPRYPGLQESEPVEDVFLSADEHDVAIVRFPARTYKGRPLAFRILDEELPRQLGATPLPTVVTFGYGMTETGASSDRLLYSRIPRLWLEYGTFESRDRFRVDHGDSGGPVILIGSGGEAQVIAVNHAYDEVHPDKQLFKPIPREFLEHAELQGLDDLPKVRCECTERLRFVSRTAPESGTGRPVAAWSDTLRDTYRLLAGAGASCERFRRAAYEERYSGEDLADGTPTVVHKRSSGIACTETRPFTTARLNGFTPAD